MRKVTSLLHFCQYPVWRVCNSVVFYDSIRVDSCKRQKVKAVEELDCLMLWLALVFQFLLSYFPGVDEGSSLILKNGTAAEFSCTVRGLLQETSFTWGTVTEDNSDPESEERNTPLEFVPFDVAMVTQGTLQTGSDGKNKCNRYVISLSTD